MGKEPLLRIKWAQRGLEAGREKFFHEVFHDILYTDAGRVRSPDMRMPKVFRQILSNKAVCICASRMNLPFTIAMLTWYFSIENGFTEALKAFVYPLERHMSNFMSSTLIGEFDGLNLPFLFTTMMAYMFLKAYSTQDSELMEYYLRSDECESFRKMVDLFYEAIPKFPNLSPLVLAATTNTVFYIEELFDVFPSLLKVTNDDFTPLHRAAIHGNVELAKILLSRDDVDPNAVVDDGISVLHTACMKDNDEIAKLILVRTNNPNVRDGKNRSSLHYCAVSDGVKCAKVLLTHTPAAIVDAVDFHLCSPLHFAARIPRSKVLKLLVEFGANTTIRDDEGEIPLHRAALQSDVENVRTLVEANPSTISFKSEVQITPLTAAAMAHRFKVVDYLLSVGAEVESDFNFEMFYMYLVNVRNKFDNDGWLSRIYSSLIVYGFNPDTLSTNRTNTVMHEACGFGRYNVVKVLLAFGANPLQKNNANETPFVFACMNGHLDVVQLIVDGLSTEDVQRIREKTMERFTDAKIKPKFTSTSFVKRSTKELIEGRDIDGNTAIFYASVNSKYTDLVEYLLSVGAQSNTQNSYGNTPLHVAIEESLFANAISILRFGQPDISIKNILGKTARDLETLSALEENHPIIMALEGKEVDWEQEVEKEHCLFYLKNIKSMKRGYLAKEDEFDVEDSNESDLSE
ncbi:hypothetical protein HK098_002974 [Nowakowskiella sp. JEL0407]|nr:hypothetical protein HK098_002974 [Nowakowskiella sp. JEL0407]